MAGLFSEMSVSEPCKIGLMAINDYLTRINAHRIVLEIPLSPTPEFDAFAQSLHETEEAFIALIKRFGYKDEEEGSQEIEDA